MNETGGDLLIPKELSIKDGKEGYCRILNSEKMPKTPNDLPREVVVPSEALGDLPRAMLATAREGIEYGQYVDWVTGRGFVKDKLNQGDENSVALNVFGSRYFLALDPVVEYHVHPPNSLAIGSSADLAITLSRGMIQPDITMVVSHDGVEALLRTEASKDSIVARYLLNVSLLSLLRYAFFKRGFDQYGSEAHQRYHVEIVKTVEENGFGYYSWRPHRDITTEDLQKGLPLSREYAPALSFLHY